MSSKQFLTEFLQVREQRKPPQHQLDWRWVERFRELASYDGHGWLTFAGPFTQEEQEQWKQHFTSLTDEAAMEKVVPLLIQSRERELEAALAEQREPKLCYPCIDILDVRRRIASLVELDVQIMQEEPNAIVRRLYHGAIEDEISFLRLIEATYEGDTQKYWHCNLSLLPLPTTEEVSYALSHIQWTVLQGLQRQETREVSEQLSDFFRNRLHISLDDLSDGNEIHHSQPTPSSPASSPHQVDAQTAKRFFEDAFKQGGYDGWRAEVDPNANNPRVESGLRVLFISNKQVTLDEIRHWIAHELIGHIARSVAGEHSLLGLLGIGTKGNGPVEEGLPLYHERRILALHGQRMNEFGIWVGTLATGLASGVLTPPQTFRSLCTFFELYALLSQLLQSPNVDMQKAKMQARMYAISLCLRTFRGVPDLEQAGICYLKDAMYLRGVQAIEHAAAEDKAVLDRLTVGRVAFYSHALFISLILFSTLLPTKYT